MSTQVVYFLFDTHYALSNPNDYREIAGLLQSIFTSVQTFAQFALDIDLAGMSSAIDDYTLV